LHGFATYHQANWDDYLPLAEDSYYSSVPHLTRQTLFVLDLRYELHLPLDLIADLQWPQDNESAKSLQGREFVERLQCILGITKDELQDALVNPMAERNRARFPIDHAITPGAKVFLYTKVLPITYANVNPV
jgi:hypothetical protein